MDVTRPLRVRLLSDLHLEFAEFEIQSLDGDSDTILILAGDIMVGTTDRDFVLSACGRFKHVIYILGNHEFYNCTHGRLVNDWRAIASGVDNLHFLENDCVVIDGVRFLGATAWTDFNGDDAKSKAYAKNSMSCFSRIRVEDGNKVRTLTPSDTVEMYSKTRSFLLGELKKPQGDWNKTVVITHHLPTDDCVSPLFVGSPLNPAFHGAMGDIIDAHCIDLWCYGHTHTSSSRTRSGTLMVNNSRGYTGYETTTETGFNPTLVIEID